MANIGRLINIGTPPPWQAVLILAVLVVTLLIFWPGLNAGFVSDAFIFLARARDSTLGTLLGDFVPSPGRYYRPLFTILFWLSYETLGERPLAFHLVAFVGHLASTVLVFVICLRLCSRRSAAAVSALVFLWALHSHEVMFEASQVHLSVGGSLLLGAVLCYVEGRYRSSVLLAAIALMMSEGGLLVLPLAGLWEIVSGARRTAGPRHAMKRLLPHVGLVAAYLALRLIAAGAHFAVEAEGCRRLRCIVVGGIEYLNRLFVRPDAAIEVIWTHRLICGAVTLGILILAVGMLAPWRWRHWEGVGFSLGWTAGSCLYFIIALWPYTSDRFLYIPDMGLALLIGSIWAETIDGWTAASGRARLGIVGVGIGLIAWLGVGAYMIRQRGFLWAEAGRLAERIVDETVALEPSLPEGATVCVSGIPDSYVPGIPPGNTGPYVFRNGFVSALRLRYGRQDITIVKECREGSRLAIAPSGTVRRIPAGAQ
ncbi:MAG TPA: hypothetical protein VMS64_22465 [Candidatus Methylomirabilis sp.]|nr:hypothetical protein [Candidatus Methylomirabilis sp.]